MDERPHPSAIADDREPAFAYRRHDLPVGSDSRSRSIEIAVAKGDSFDAVGTAHGMLEVADRLKRFLLIARRGRVERILLGREAGACARIGPVAVALGNEPPGTRCLCSLQQVIYPFGPQAVRQCKLVVELLVILHTCKGRQLVDHDLRLGLLQRLHDSGTVERIGNNQLRTSRAQWLDVLWGAGHHDDLVAACDQLRYQPLPDGASGASNKYLHGRSPFACTWMWRQDQEHRSSGFSPVAFAHGVPDFPAFKATDQVENGWNALNDHLYSGQVASAMSYVRSDPGPPSSEDESRTTIASS